MKKKLFIHGIESHLSDAKKEILLQYGQVWYPVLD